MRLCRNATLLGIALAILIAVSACHGKGNPGAPTDTTIPCPTVTTSPIPVASRALTAYHQRGPDCAWIPDQ